MYKWLVFPALASLQEGTWCIKGSMPSEACTDTKWGMGSRWSREASSHLMLITTNGKDCNQKHFAFICKASLKRDYLIISFSTARLQNSPTRGSHIKKTVLRTTAHHKLACVEWLWWLRKPEKTGINHYDDLPSSFSNKEPEILLCWVANMRTVNQVAVALETLSRYTGPRCDERGQ